MSFQKLISFFLSVILFLSSGVTFGKCDPDTARTVASSAYAREGYRLTEYILKKSYDRQRHVFKEQLGDGGAAYIWATGSVIEMIADAYRLFPANLKLRTYYSDALTKVLQNYLVEDAQITTPGRVHSGVSYYNASAGNRGDYYYDDNEWVCIELLRGYQQLGKKELLKAALTNLEFLWTGWDDALGGGIYWSMSCEGKNACANAPAAIAFLLAYQCTGKEEYLEKGTMICRWMNETMRENDLFIDAVNVATGNKDRWKGIYNQATMIYAGCLLYEITGGQEWYDLTKATVRAVETLMFTETETEDGGTDVAMNLNPIFSAWCVGWLARSLVKYYETDPAKDTRPMALLEAVLDKELATRDEEGLFDPFFCSGGSNPEAYRSLLSQDGVASTFLNAAYYDAALKER